MIKIFFSHGMRGLTTDEILAYRHKRWKDFILDVNVYLTKAQIDQLTPSTTWIDTVLSDKEVGSSPDDPKFAAKCLAKSLCLMANSDIIIFDTNYQDYRGCRIEYTVAKEYQLPFKVMIK